MTVPPCGFLRSSTAVIISAGRVMTRTCLVSMVGPFDAKAGKPFAANSLKPKSALRIAGNGREDLSEPGTALDAGRKLCQEFGFGGISIALIVSECFEPRCQIGGERLTQFLHADRNARDRFSLEVEDPPLNRHIVLG